ncbi:MAG: TIGR00296 family protein [Candidatus Hydrothermarchaeaceae archaeon]
MYTVEDGSYLISLSRSAVKTNLSKGRLIPSPPNTPKKLRKKAGVFVTLETYPGKKLRGCIGYPEPVMPLVEATIRAAVSAATGDPRFPPVQPGELDNLILEVSLLTPPELIAVKSPSDYQKLINIGQHGLIVERGYHKGLLLPQVPVDHGWGLEDFLSHTCMKAGLPPDSWFEESTLIHRFEGKVFAETRPMGAVEERKLG